MKYIRRHIILTSIIWFCSVVILDTVIPLHFFVKQHHHSICNTDEKSCCSSTESNECQICAFDLYIGYPQQFNFEIKRTDILIYTANDVLSSNVFYRENLYTQLRAPPEKASWFLTKNKTSKRHKIESKLDGRIIQYWVFLSSKILSAN